jgi:hypothetical protein
MLHDATVHEVERAFVEALPQSPHRRAIFDAYLEHTRAWLGIIGGEPREQWMDGSFTTAESRPGRPRDVDVVLFVPAQALAELPRDAHTRFRLLFEQSGPLCHAAAVRTYPEDHPSHVYELRQREQWARLFSHQRVEDGGRAKGIVRLRLGGDSSE